MNKPDNFIQNTDYTTFKNDSRGEVSISAPGSIVVAGSSNYTTTANVVLGQKNAMIRSTIASLKNANRKLVGSYQISIRTGLITGLPATYSIGVAISRLNTTTIQIQITIFNPYSDPLTTAVGTETFTASINTFLSPFA